MNIFRGDYTPLSGEDKEIFANFLASRILVAGQGSDVVISRFFVRQDVVRLDVIRLDIVGRGVVGGRGVVNRVAFGPGAVLATASDEEHGTEGEEGDEDKVLGVHDRSPYKSCCSFFCHREAVGRGDPTAF